MTATELRGGGWLSAVHPDDRTRVLERRGTDSALASEVAIEYRLLKPDGTVVNIAARRAPIRDENGNLTGYMGTLSDVTELKDAIRRARESQARFRALLDQAPMPMSLRDLDGRFVVINAHAARVIGRSVEDLLGRAPAELYDPAVAAEIATQDRNVRAGEDPITYEVTGPDADGHERDFFVTKYEAPGVIVGDPMAALPRFAGPLHGESAIWKSCAGCAPTEAAKRPSGVVVASSAERMRTPAGGTVGSMAVRSSSGMRVDRSAAAHFHIVAAVSGRTPPWSSKRGWQSPRVFRRDPAGTACVRGTTENWSAASFDTNKRSRAFTYDHARRARNIPSRTGRATWSGSAGSRWM
jgi:PAS domain S-box-containing protein